MLRPVLLASIVALGLPSLAWAAPRAEVPVPALADGTTATTVVLSVPGLRPGDPVKAKAEHGRVDDVRIVAPGVLTARVLPDARATPGTMLVSIRGKGASGKVSADLQVPLRGGLAAAIRPGGTVPGAKPGDGPVTLRLAAPETGQPHAARSLSARVSAGRVGAVRAAEGGGFELDWTPPASAKGSQVVVLTLSDAAAPDRVVGVVALPLQAEASLTLPAPADSQNTLQHGGETLGPAKASPAGTVAFTVAVDPRAPTATLQTTTPDGRVRTQQVELDTADAATLAFVPGPAARVADPSRPQPVLVAALDARGAPVTDAPPVLGASRGTLGVARATGVPGIWRADYTPPDAPGNVTFTATAGASRVEQRVELVAAPPAVTLAPAASPLPPDARSLSVTVVGAGGAPALEARGARMSSRPRKTPEGTTFVLTPEADAAGIWLLASPPGAARGGPPATATLTGPDAAPESGPRPYTVRLTDAAGLPVPRAAISVSAGWAEDLDASATTDDAGLARVWLTPPGSGAAVLTVQAGGIAAGTVLGPGLPAPGPSAHAPTTWVPREAPPAVAVAAPAEPAPAATEPAGPATDTAPAPDPVAAVPATPRPSGPDTATPWLRAGLSGGLGGLDWAQDADDGIAGPEDETERAGYLPLGLGAGALGLHAQAWFGDGPIGLELDLVGQAGDFAGDPAPTLRGGLGVQGRFGIGGALSLYGHLGAGTTPGYLIVYEDGDPEDETGVTQRVMGGQVGAGVLLLAPTVFVDIGVRELWAPWPVQTEGRMDIGLHVAERLSVDLRGRMSRRTMAYEVDGEAIDTQDTMAYVGVGVSLLAR